MKISEFKTVLAAQETISFQLPDGSLVPSHFHVTEVGKVIKHFIDCGGTERLETVINFQLWEANDYDHRLHPEKLVSIIELSQNKLGLPDAEIEVEYQSTTIGKYGLEFDGVHFLLTSKLTNCLAKDACGVSTLNVIDTGVKNNSCSPNSNCC